MSRRRGCGRCGRRAVSTDQGRRDARRAGRGAGVTGFAERQGLAEPPEARFAPTPGSVLSLPAPEAGLAADEPVIGGESPASLQVLGHEHERVAMVPVPVLADRELSVLAEISTSVTTTAETFTIAPSWLPERMAVILGGAAEGSRGSSLRRAGEISCDRPGCYEHFVRTRRSPAQRFCARPCRRALERVWQREARWRDRHGLSPPSTLSGAREVSRKY